MLDLLQQNINPWSDVESNWFSSFMKTMINWLNLCLNTQHSLTSLLVNLCIISGKLLSSLCYCELYQFLHKTVKKTPTIQHPLIPPNKQNNPTKHHRLIYSVFETDNGKRDIDIYGKQYASHFLTSPSMYPRNTASYLGKNLRLQHCGKSARHILVAACWYSIVLKMAIN